MKLSDLQEGDLLPGDSGTSMDKVPEWMDFDKFHRGRQFFLRHTAAILLYLNLSIAVGMSISNILDPLVFNNFTNTPKKAFKRYYMTFLHVTLWHYGDVWDAPNGKAHRSLKKVRSMHTSIAKRMNSNAETKQKVFVSQYDMALVQSAFFAPVILHPHSFGIRYTRKELEDYIFFWRGIGYLLGIEDKYNICSGSFEETVAISVQIEQEVLWPYLKDPPQNFEPMLNAYVAGTNLAVYFSLMSKDVLLEFANICFGFPRSSLGFLDNLRMGLLRWAVMMIRWCPFYEQFVNYLFMRAFHRDLHLLKL